jgi:hypothetical protein
LKALSYENTRLKGENKTLISDNKTLKSEVMKLTDSINSKPIVNVPKPGALAETYEKIKKLNDTVQNLQI